MTLCTSTTAVVAAAGRPKTPRRLAAAVNIRRSSAGGGGGGSHSPLRRPLLREDLLAASAPQQKSQRRHRHRRWVVNASAGPDGGWRVRQIYGDGKVLLDQLREVAELLADGFNASGRSSKDLLNGLVQKVRWSGGNFICLVADDGDDGSEMVGACDLTLLPAGGPKMSREGLVVDVPSQLALAPDAHFLYLTGMVVPEKYRRRRIGQSLLSQCAAMAPKMQPPPACIALHVDANNAPARGLYQAAGYRVVGGEGAGEGEASGDEREEKKADGGGGGWSFPSLGLGKRTSPKVKKAVLMVKWLPPKVNDGEDVADDLFGLRNRKW